MSNFKGKRAALLVAVIASNVFLSQARGEDLDGKRVYQRANCVGCHKWHGNGGGGYGGDALSLRKTELTKEQIVDTVRCGRPGTGMPYHARSAYDNGSCFEISRADLGDKMPPEAAIFLRPPEIEAVAAYVIANIKGKGEPSLEDCLAFFGGGHVCDIYKKSGGDSASPVPVPAPSGSHG